MPVAELAVHIDGLVRGSDDPPDGDVFIFWDSAGAILVQAVGGAAVHAQLILVEFPIEDDLVGGVAEAEIGGVGLGDDGNFDGRTIGLACVEMVFSIEDGDFGQCSKRKPGDSGQEH